MNALAQAGVLRRTRAGNQVRFQADPRCSIHEDLRNTLKKTVGVANVLREVNAMMLPALEMGRKAGEPFQAA